MANKNKKKTKKSMPSTSHGRRRGRRSVEASFERMVKHPENCAPCHLPNGELARSLALKSISTSEITNTAAGDKIVIYFTGDAQNTAFYKLKTTGGTVWGSTVRVEGSANQIIESVGTTLNVCGASRVLYTGKLTDCAGTVHSMALHPSGSANVTPSIDDALEGWGDNVSSRLIPQTTYRSCPMSALLDKPFRRLHTPLLNYSAFGHSKALDASFVTGASGIRWTDYESHLSGVVVVIEGMAAGTSVRVEPTVCAQAYPGGLNSGVYGPLATSPRQTEPGVLERASRWLADNVNTIFTPENLEVAMGVGQIGFNWANSRNSGPIRQLGWRG